MSQKEEDDKPMYDRINEIEERNEKNLPENNSSENKNESENIHPSDELQEENPGKNIELVKNSENSQEEIKLQNESVPPTEEFFRSNMPEENPILLPKDEDEAKNRKSTDSIHFSENNDNIENKDQNIKDGEKVEDELLEKIESQEKLQENGIQPKEYPFELEKKSCEENNKKEIEGDFQSNEFQIKKEDQEKPFREKGNLYENIKKN